MRQSAVRASMLVLTVMPIALSTCVGGEAQLVQQGSSAAAGGSGDCPEGESFCGNACVDTMLDEAHCGGCDMPCPAGELCSAGGCGFECVGGTTKCADQCVDTQVDPKHCGGCGIACEAGEDCSGGGCCPFGQTFCGGTCTDTSADPEHCGGCDVMCGSTAPVCAAGRCIPALPSCTAHQQAGATASGVYPLDPDGRGGAAGYDAYCDMSTDGGGWTLVLAYAHAGGQNEPLVAGPLPIDPLAGYGHASLALMQQLPFSEIRLYCETSAHGRKVHFKTSSGAVNYFRGVTGNGLIYWTSGFTTLSDHSANLPAAANTVFDQSGDDRMTEFPFYVSGAHHWGIRGLGDRFECDDYPDGPAHTTLHQVWVR